MKKFIILFAILACALSVRAIPAVSLLNPICTSPPASVDWSNFGQSLVDQGAHCPSYAAHGVASVLGNLN